MVCGSSIQACWARQQGTQTVSGQGEGRRPGASGGRLPSSGPDPPPRCLCSASSLDAPKVCVLQGSARPQGRRRRGESVIRAVSLCQDYKTSEALLYNTQLFTIEISQSTVLSEKMSGSQWLGSPDRVQQLLRVSLHILQMSIIFKTKEKKPPPRKKYRITILLSHSATATCPALPHKQNQKPF